MNKLLNQQQKQIYTVPALARLLIMAQRSVRLRIIEAIEAGVLPESCLALNGRYYLNSDELALFRTHLWHRRTLSRARRAQACRAVAERRASFMGRLGLK